MSGEHYILKPCHERGSVSFISKWTKSGKPTFTEKVRDVVKRPPPLKARIELAQKKLQVQVTRLDAVYSKLKEKDQSLFRKVVSALNEHDMQYAAVLSGELSQIRKIGKMVSHAKLALEQIQIRLNTITELGDVVVTLSPAMAVVKNVRSGLTGMMPEVDGEMEEISQLLNGILVESSQVPNASVPYTQSGTDTDSQSILEEAASIAENTVKDKLPDLPLMMRREKAPDNDEETPI